MLHLETVEPRVVPLLKRLFALDELAGFSLVGGTALALRYGHRRSVDLDLFTAEEMDQARVLAALQKEFGDLLDYKPSKASWAVFCQIDQVKVDIVRYPHPRIAPVIVDTGIRFYDDADIAAMKVQAILGRGSKKDFWDMVELLKHHDLQWIMDRHAAKYPNQMVAISIPQALIYFADAEEGPDPVSLQGQTWEGIKRSITKAVGDYLR